MAIEGLSDIIKNSISEAEGEELEVIDTEGGDNGDGTEVIPATDDEIEPVDGEPEVPAAEEPEAEKAKVEEPAPEAVEKPADGEDEFAKEHGIKSKDKNGRVNRIPYPEVVRINKNAVAKAQTKWEAETLAPVKATNKVYEDRLLGVGKTEEIMFGNAGQFLGMLLKIPGYREVLGDVKLDANGHVIGVGTAAAPAPPAADTNDPEPPPDVDLGNGQTGYSAEQFKKLRAYDRRQAARDAAAEARAGFDKDFKPIKEVFDRGQASRAQQTAIDTEISAALKWPGFEANHAAILKAMDDDYREQVPNLQAGRTANFKFKSMRDAYDHVMFGLVTAKGETAAQTEARLRKEITESLRRAPRSTQAGAGAVAAVAGRGEEAPQSDNPTADLVRRSIKAK